MFRRRRQQQPSEPVDAESGPGPESTDEEASTAAAGAAVEGARREPDAAGGNGVDEGLDTEPVREPPRGPWDEADEPDDGINRVDLGGIKVPVTEGTEVRVEVSPQGQVMAATLVHGDSAMQVNAFAAPRSEGIWDEVRAEIAASLADGPGSAEEAPGTFGPEVVARLPAQAPAQGSGQASAQASQGTAATPTTTLQPGRFVGIDGPRWFVRALFTGRAATELAAAEPLTEALRAIVVVRGDEAMAPRDPLPLRLPPDVADATTRRRAEIRDQGGVT